MSGFDNMIIFYGHIENLCYSISMINDYNIKISLKGEPGHIDEELLGKAVAGVPKQFAPL